METKPTQHPSPAFLDFLASPNFPPDIATDRAFLLGYLGTSQRTPATDLRAYTDAAGLARNPEDPQGYSDRLFCLLAPVVCWRVGLK